MEQTEPTEPTGEDVAALKIPVEELDEVGGGALDFGSLFASLGDRIFD